MSAFMMPEKTTAIIAEYLALAADCVGHTGTVEGVKTIEPPKSLLQCLRDEGCYNAKYDEYEPSAIYRVMRRLNYKAYAMCYGGDEPDEIPVVNIPKVSIAESKRREWLANLYTVARCYRFQCAEGTIPASAFFKAFSAWIDIMASKLAEFVVDEIRPKDSEHYKPWDRF